MSDSPTGWIEHAESRFEAAGLQRSEPRRRVVAWLADRDCAVTALEIDAELDGIGRATIYRAIEQLEKLALIRRVDLGGASLGYERIDPSGEHHHHLVCRNCGRVIPFQDEALEAAIHALQHPDFTIESHEITLQGLCADCR